MFYELAADTWGDEERAAVQRVIDSGRLTMGPEVEAFEAEFAAYFGRKYAVMANSGSSANLIGIAALGYLRDGALRRGDEVIVPVISWSTTYAPLQQYGLRLKFIDVELDTLNMDVRRLDEAVTADTKAIVGVSVLGNPAALEAMRTFADTHGLIFFEDNCESMDAELDGRKTGTFGDIGTFSTFFSHHISTGEGGVMTTDDPEINDLARSIRAHGWVRDLSEDSVVAPPKGDEFSEAYRFILPGYNVRPQEINAAVGREQLKKLPEMTAARRKNLAQFNERFSGDARFTIQQENGKSSCFCFPIILNSSDADDRERVFAALREADIGFRMITGGCFTRHDVIKHFDYELVGEMVNGDRAHDYGFFVGNHPFDLTDQIDKLYDVLNGVCR